MNEQDNNNFKEKLQHIFASTCGTWENCNEVTVISFLTQCLNNSIDPQFGFSWLEEHQEEIPDWTNFSDTAQDWISEHTSTGTPISMKKE